MKVLIVDDNKNFVNALQFILLNLDEKPIVKEIFTALNGKEGLEIVAHNHIDIVFMDMEMPVMDGAEATHKILQINQHTKVIALSSHNEIECVQKMICSGAVNYLKKDQLSVKIILNVFKTYIDK